MEDARIHLLEQTVSGITAREKITSDMLTAILNIFERDGPLIEPQKPKTPVAETSAPTAPSSASVGHPMMSKAARPAVPPDFDGDRTKGIAFLNACRIYLRLCPDEFPDEQTKIVWAMSYMKSGRAQRWTARVFHWEDLSENSGCARFIDWEDFRDEFRKDFTPTHADAAAINKLESPSYHQMSRTLDDYLDEFQDLITDSGYTDPKTVVVKFRRGLNPEIQNAVATMGVGRPSDTCPQSWYAMARIVDQNRAANEAFMSSSALTTVTSAPTRE
jgi:hypothetical protein